MPPKQQNVVPLHIHLAKLNFLKYRSDGRIFTAKPPDHFLWTCETLGLTVPKEYLDNCVSEKLKKTVSTAVQVEDENEFELSGNEDEQNLQKDHYLDFSRDDQSGRIRS